MCVSPPSRSFRNWRIVSQLLVPYHPIHVSRCASQLNPGHISTPSRSCRLNYSPLKVPSWCNSSPKICVSPSSRSCITYIQVPILLCHLHSSTILITNIRISPSPLPRPSRSRYSHFTTIQVTSHLNPGHDNWILDVVTLQRIQVSRWLSQLNPCPISPPAKSQDLHLTPSQAPRFISLLHLGPFSTKFRSWCLCFTSILVTTHLQPGPQNGISAPSKPD